MKIASEKINILGVFFIFFYDVLFYSFTTNEKKNVYYLRYFTFYVKMSKVFLTLILILNVIVYVFQTVRH